jgi:GTP:adenosylcobinamide-phosphate guanylyltransferase
MTEDRMTMHTAQTLDVIITAGDRRGSRSVLGANKAFLPVAGVPLIHHVLSAVERAHCTARIFVVGDKARLQEMLTTGNTPFQTKHSLTLLEQGNSLYDNVWKAFLHTLPDFRPGIDWRDYMGTSAVDKAVLVMPGDIPLATPFEIDEFVSACDTTCYDYCLGLTASSVLSAYYPADGRAGIQMDYYALRDVQVRQNNLHLVKPLRIGNRYYIQEMYDMRYQQEWGNIVKLCWQLWRAKDASMRMLWAYLCLHIANLSVRYSLCPMAAFRPFHLDKNLVASLLSQLLRTRLTMVETHYGGCAMDVDNADHYHAICANFDRWLNYQNDLADELKQQA